MLFVLQHEDAYMAYSQDDFLGYALDAIWRLKLNLPL